MSVLGGKRTLAAPARVTASGRKRTVCFAKGQPYFPPHVQNGDNWPFSTQSGHKTVTHVSQSYVGRGKLRLQDLPIEAASATHMRSASLSAPVLSFRRMR